VIFNAFILVRILYKLEYNKKRTQEMLGG